jgi:hypothetical protein
MCCALHCVLRCAMLNYVVWWFSLYCIITLQLSNPITTALTIMEDTIPISSLFKSVAVAAPTTLPHPLPRPRHSGRREWAIENSFVSAEEELAREVPNVDTRLLRDFRCDQSWVLEAGDVLYLPPRVPHRGKYAQTYCV